jgi:inner membrane protein involved in colicin E2 resistance
MLDYIVHKLGITFITVAFIYIFIITIRKNKALLPFWFYLLYGIGGVLIFIIMLGQQKPFVYYNELIGFIIAFILAGHSFMYYKT